MSTAFQCLLHADRAAVARCPSCRRFFCAECVSEHAGRLLCAHCLTAQRMPKSRARTSWRMPARILAAAAGGALVWVLFFWLGDTLASRPAPTHDQDLWRETPLTAP